MHSTSSQSDAIDQPQYTLLGESTAPKPRVQQLGPTSVLVTYDQQPIGPSLQDHFNKSLSVKPFDRKEHHPHVPASFWIRRHRRSSRPSPYLLPPPPPLPSSRQSTSSCSTANLLRSSGFGWPSYNPAGGRTAILPNSWGAGFPPNQQASMRASSSTGTFSSWTPLGYSFTSPTIDSSVTSYPPFASGFETGIGVTDACGVPQWS